MYQTSIFGYIQLNYLLYKIGKLTYPDQKARLRLFLKRIRMLCVQRKLDIVAEWNVFYLSKSFVLK
jgi:hypothetical protein